MIGDLETKNQELTERLKESNDNTDAKFEIVELKQKIDELECEKVKLVASNDENVKYIADKENVISDCNIYIENLTEQLNEKTEQLDNLSDKMQNNSTINAKDEEIASLQAELALLHDNQDKVDTLEHQVLDLKTEIAQMTQESEKQVAKIEQLETDLVAEHEQFSGISSEMADCNVQVASLKAQLAKRNDEIVEFLKIMKKLKENLRSCGSPLSAFIDVNEEDSKELSWDHGYDNILEPTKNFIEKLVDETLEKSRQNEVDKSSHIKFLDERVGDLENILVEKENLIEELRQNDRDVTELQLKLEESEKEQFEMQSYLNGKLSEIKKLRQDLLKEQDLNKVNEEKLSKAMSAIQGFVTENLKLSKSLAEKDLISSEGNAEQLKQLDVLFLENERLKAELSQANIECSAKTFYMQKGIDKARSEYNKNLVDYRVKFDWVLEAWKSSRDQCDLMRERLEELADFLQQVLDNEPDDLNISCLSVHIRDLLQKSIDESRLLSASIVASQNSVLQEMSMVGLDIVDDNVEHLGEETWLVPDVDVSLFDNDHDDETVPKREYDCLLLELRDNLTKRRVAEEELEKLKTGFEDLSVEHKSKIPVADENIKSRGRSGSRRRKTLTKIPGPSAVTEDDDWSEPDKEESRRRIGLKDDDEEDVVTGLRSSDEENVNNNAQVGAELRRERGRVDRLRSELSASNKKQAELIKQLEVCSKALEKCKKEIKKKDEFVSKIDVKNQQIEGENDQQREILRLIKIENTELGRRVGESNIMIEKLNKGIEWWKTECKRVKEEFEIIGDGSNHKYEFNEKLQVSDKKISDLEGQIKKLERENENLIQTLVDTEEKDYESLRADYQRKKSEMGKLKGTNLLLEERCLELEEVIRSNDVKIEELEQGLEKMQEVKRRQSLVISNKEENLSQAEILLKELNENNKTLKSDLELSKKKVKESVGELKHVQEMFSKYRQEFSDEIIQNKVNEVETKMRSQAEGVKKMAEELVKVDEAKKTLESKLVTRADLLKTAKKEIHNLKETLENEKYKAEEVGKTIEIMRNNIERLENEKLQKDSLEKEFNSLQKQLEEEKNLQKTLQEKVDKLEKSKKLTEDRCASAEKVLKALSAESFQENKENKQSKHNMSKHEVETALQMSRPGSRRQGLSSLDNNQTRSSLPVNLSHSGSSCCSHLKLERDAALAKLNTTRSSLASAAQKLNQSNKRKKEMEKEICQQLSKTHQVLRKTKTNLENYSNNSGAGAAK